MKKNLLLLLMLCIAMIAGAQEDDDPVAVRDVAVTLQKAGTLDSVLSDMSPETITGLKITGDINGSDIFALRELCTHHYYEEDDALLHKLDLTDARIVAGGESYYDDIDYGGDGSSKFTEDDVVGELMFYQCSLLDTLLLPRNVKAVGKGAFQDMTLLKEMRLPATVTKIGQAAFRGCGSLAEVNIPEGVDSIAPYTFGYCEALRSIELPSSLRYIGMGGFMKCTSLESVSVPEGVDSLGMGAFMTCDAMRVVRLPSTLHGIARFAFGNAEALDSLYMAAQTPPAGEPDVFTGMPAGAVLAVPQGCVQSYENSPIFNVFQHIVELTPTADDALVLTSTDYNNTYDLEQRLGETMDVVIKRPIKADEWDALSLPFSLSAEEVSEYFGPAAVVEKIIRLGDTAKGEPEHSLVVRDTTAMEAGMPYLLKAGTASESIRFKNVTIERSTGVTQMLDESDENYSYAYAYFSCADMLGSGAYLVQPNGTLACAPDASSGLELYETPGFFASFYLPDSWGQDAEVSIVKEEVYNGISNQHGPKVSDNRIFNLNGMEVSGKGPLPKGIYIKNGKKVCY